nr:PREDICTED: E3 ubiquitin-protein ligase UHRF1-like [Bemisia tabaci]
MYVQVRTIDGKQKITLNVSKTISVENFRKEVEKAFDVPCDKQRLFYRGKQLEDEHSLFDYNVNVNDVIQLMVRQAVPEPSTSTSSEATSTEVGKEPAEEEEKPSTSTKVESKYFKIGDHVDAKDSIYGAWFEGQIVDIIKVTKDDKPKSSEADDNDGETKTSDENEKQENEIKDESDLEFMIAFKCYPDDPPAPIKLNDIRPRMSVKVSIDDVKVGDRVLVNYNIEEPTQRGYWYDCLVKSITKSRKNPELVGTLSVGTENISLENCKIKFTDELMKVETVKLMKDRTAEEESRMQDESTDSRANAPYCTRCNDNPRRNCKECGCHVCGKKDEPAQQLMCDECNMPYHIWCLNPPLESIPDIDEWYCAECKNDENEIVKAGEKLKDSKKKAKMASKKNNTSRDWGKGMACVGRMKECSIVPSNHFGPVPGVEVGTIWKFRLQASEAGIHRPHVAGIHGRESEGAYSIVLSGGYEDDVDDGEEFLYTGSGGRDLSGNKRTADQSSDQKLTRMNRALALNCNAPLNDKEGATAKDWKGGKPVRVVRNYKAAKHSKYAPEDGNRYDGIYKVVKYYPEKGKSGFIVWRYLIRRDDPTPAPWTKAGKKHIEAHNLEMKYPDGYLEALEAKKSLEGPDTPQSAKKKRVLKELSDTQSPPAKKTKVAAYKLPAEDKSLIESDSLNTKLWESCTALLSQGKQKFLDQVQESFVCICCQELVHEPVTTPCSHNICHGCLKRSFNASVYTCPHCRADLGNKYELKVNKNLSTVLLSLFPGYQTGR